jgi:hypothetical protein
LLPQHNLRVNIWSRQVRREHLVALTKSPSLWTDTLKGQPGAKASLAASRKPLGVEKRQLSLEEIFELIDLDGDGELTKDEVQGAHQERGPS